VRRRRKYNIWAVFVVSQFFCRGPEKRLLITITPPHQLTAPGVNSGKNGPDSIIGLIPEITMTFELDLDMSSQPDDYTCGPTCLHAVYEYFGDSIPLEEVIREVERVQDGGTLAVLLGRHALSRGYRATIYTYNLHVFDPTWFAADISLSEKLRAQAAVKHDAKLAFATGAYRDFLKNGGQVLFQDLTTGLIRRYLKRAVPILTGLSSTYLYRSARENQLSAQDDDIGGQPSGHFVVLYGYDRQNRRVLVADPYKLNPVSRDHFYSVSIDRLLGAIMLGILTYDANFLVIEPSRSGRRNR